MTTLLDITATREEFLVYQPHRLQLSGCARAFEGAGDKLIQAETLGEGLVIPLVQASETYDISVVDVS